MGLLVELTKRRVIATGAIYVPAAWLAAEILLAVFERFALPAWTGDVVVMLFLLGFPVALLLSWLFDVTADGVKRAAPSTPLGIVAILASGLFLSFGSYLSYQVFSGELDEISIAILPLQSNAADPETQAYGFGIADGLRIRLREIPAFRVPASTSSQAALDSGLDIPSIAARLGASFVMEGTVQMAGDRLNINVTLMDEAGDVIWSERYQREAQELFGLQRELARTIAVNLGVGESHPALEEQSREPLPTSDAEAYRLYLRGKYTVDLSGEAEGGRRLELLMQARELDPTFAEVYPAIAQEYANECWGLDDRNNPACELAVNFANEGLALDPELGDALAILAFVHSLRYEYEEAQQAIDRFDALGPPPIVSQAMPWVYLNLGRLQEAWDAAEEFYENDPLNVYALGNITGWSYSVKRDQELFDHYDVMMEEMMGGISPSAGFPYMRSHRVGLEQAIEEGRIVSELWQTNPDLVDVVTPVFYDPSLREAAADELQAMFERGEIRAPIYYGWSAGLGRVDAYIDSAFELYDERQFNPVHLWLYTPAAPDVRTHPRYFELLEHIGIADYWDEVGWPPFCDVSGEERDCGLETSID